MGEEVKPNLGTAVEEVKPNTLTPTLSIGNVPVWKYNAYSVENGESIVTTYEGAEINITFAGGILSVNGYDYRGIATCYLMRDKSGKFQMIKVVTEANSHMFVKLA